MILLDQLKESIDFVRGRSNLKPRIGITLGSGLSSFVRSMDVETSIPYREIPHFSPSSVEGHPGNLVLGNIGETPVVVLQGRIHYYEGHSMDQVVYPTRMVAQLGIENLVLTNAAGGVDERMRPGDFMIIRDHVNLTGNNPLIGPNISELGLRFPDMTQAYDANLIEKLKSVMNRKDVRFHEGVYCGVSGPTYETPAEIKFLQTIGGSAVGMSTVPETIAARHMGVRVCGISFISNSAAGLGQQQVISHEDVKVKAAQVEQNFADFLAEFISEI